MARLRFGHQRPLNRRCPDEKYQYVNNNRLTEYPGTPAWTPADTRDLLVAGVQASVDTCDLVVAGVRISISPKYLYLYLELSGSTSGMKYLSPRKEKLSVVMSKCSPAAYRSRHFSLFFSRLCAMQICGAFLPSTFITFT